MQREGRGGELPDQLQGWVHGEGPRDGGLRQAAPGRPGVDQVGLETVLEQYCRIHDRI